MKILVVSNIEWSVENAFGNTVTNWFAGMENVEFASLYARSSKPNNPVCSHYYAISPKSVVKNFFSPEKIGSEMIIEDHSFETKKNTEKRAINFLHSFKLLPVKAIDEAVFAHAKWNNAKFRNFAEKFSPDIIFTFVTGSRKIRLMIDAVRKIKPDVKLAVYIADDVYGNSSRSGRKTVEKIIDEADLLFGASDLLCSEYEKIFGKKIIPLRKGCVLGSQFREREENGVIRIVYAGNLYYGRDAALARICEAIKKANKTADRKLILTVFTSTPVPKKYEAVFNDKECCEFMGPRSYSEVMETMRGADLALHAESFSEKWKKVVRYSYSTKISDCIESGAMIFAVGPEGIASIEEVRKIPGALVVDRLDDLDGAVASIPETDINAGCRLIREYAQEHFEISMIRRELFSYLSELS